MSYNTFLSWSGDRSYAAAQAFRVLLVDVINAAEPFLSKKSIEKGTRGQVEMQAALDECKCGVLFVNRENLVAPWLLFEAGALAKSTGTAHACTFLMDLTWAEVKPPLADLQHTVATEDDVFQLFVTINKAIQAGRTNEDLKRAFDTNWPTFKRALDSIPPLNESDRQPERSQRDLLVEILENSRRAATAAAAATSSPPVRPAIGSVTYLLELVVELATTGVGIDDVMQLLEKLITAFRQNPLDVYEGIGKSLHVRTHVARSRFGQQLPPELSPLSTLESRCADQYHAFKAASR